MADIAHPLGKEDIFSFHEAIDAVRTLRRQSNRTAYLLKLNDEEAGNGIAVFPSNAVVMNNDDLKSAISISKDIPFSEFESRLAEEGGVVEEFVDRKHISNPSVKMFIGDDGKVVNLATHDQMLANLSYSGCMFPANADYRTELRDLGYRVADALVAKGVKGIFSVDFLAGRDNHDEEWSLWALEINIRKGATTHPYFWTRLLARAEYYEDVGVLRDDRGEVVYISSEYITADGLSNFSIRQVIDAIRIAGIEYSREKRSGVFLHMGSCVKEFSKFGVTIIASSHQSASDLLATLQRITAELATTGGK